jgi:hypothetical protein
VLSHASRQPRVWLIFNVRQKIMMSVYYDRVSWISGVAFLVAFVITLWPSRKTICLASILWAVGSLADAGLSAFSMYAQGGISFAFSTHGGFPLFALVLPLLSLSSIVSAGVLLLPRVSKEKARKGALVIFLIALPLVVVVPWLAYFRQGMHRFPFGIGWLGMPLLWFRIRELTDKNEEKA